LNKNTPMTMDKSAKIYVAGHRGMVGSSIIKRLTLEGYTNLITRTSQEIDLRNQNQVELFFKQEKPEYVFMCAAKVGGIIANNTFRADFIYDNIMIASNIIHNSYKYGVKKLLNLGSTCIYPKFAPQPMEESSLLTGILEPTNEPYAIAKIAAIKICESYRDQYGCNFISVMPTNLYGPNDNYDLNNSHVLPALIRKFHEAKINKLQEVICWGSGTPKREFLHTDDLSRACVYLMKSYNDKQFVNIGVGTDLSIKELAEMVSNIVGFEGNIIWDSTKPDGTPRKLVDVTKLNSLGFKAEINLEDGIKSVYEEFKTNYESNINRIHQSFQK
jgi:GDP-L-fucose synthase